MSQGSYIWEILRRFGMSDCNSVSTPLDPSQKLEKKADKSSDGCLACWELIGCLTYLTSTTRPIIAFSASYLRQFNNCFNKSHWKASKRVLRYLKRTMNFGLVCRPDSKPLTGKLHRLRLGKLSHGPMFTFRIPVQTEWMRHYLRNEEAEDRGIVNLWGRIYGIDRMHQGNHILAAFLEGDRIRRPKQCYNLRR